jgi:hypothetical protein
LQVLKLKDLPNWTRPLEDKTMPLSQLMDNTVQKINQSNWKQLTKEVIDLWTTVFNGLVILGVLTYLTGEAFGHSVHNLNDWLTAKWLQVLGLTGPTELGRASPTNVGIVEETIAVEVEPKLPPETKEVVETPVLDEPPPTSPRKRRRQSAPPEVVQAVEAEFSKPRRPRGQRAHARRHQAA